jgi:myosin heavy subunit
MDNEINVWVKKENDWKHGILLGEEDNLYKININGNIKYYNTYCIKNDDSIDDMDNMIDIPHLNEPSILNGIDLRYNNNKIYTYTGNILISVNPFNDLGLYSNDLIKDYHSNKETSPHIYNIARDSYNNLIKTNNNQSILVSGESGAGKTHATKIMMEYITSVSGKNKDIEDKILLSNPILEAFGNARTIRNDNSSRFGKFIKLKFNNNNKLCEAQIDTYLLEKVRLIYQGCNERNFHIFYQILKGMSEEDKNKYMINDSINYNYLKNGLINRLDGVSDSEEYNIVIDGFKKLCITDKEVDNILRTTSSILNIGNLEYDDEGNIINDEQIEIITKLLGLNRDKLIFTLTKRELLVSNDKIVIKLSKEECIYIRDSLSMKIYNDLFNYILQLINRSLKTDEISDRFIGILDIFGFESIDINSFEQLCINYTNENLQNQFNKYIFKLEQEEYKREGINWESIEFPDNEECLKMIDGRNGILGMLDEECRLPKGNDKNYTLKLNKRYNESIYFTIRKRYIDERFSINHYAGNVIYNTKGFCDKNKDLLSNEINSLLIDISICQPNSKNINISSLKMISVGYQFKRQLKELIKVIDDTKTHYVRCIKPNDLNKELLFNREKVCDQLRYCGVIEAIKVARSGYSVRMKHNEFINRYRMIEECKDVSTISRLNFIKVNDCQIGLTKVFLKSDIYEKLEDTRINRLSYHCIIIQKNIRRYILRKKYLRIYSRIILLQVFCRIILSKKRLLELKRNNSSTIIGRNYRMWINKRKYLIILKKINYIQKYYRAYTYKKFILKVILIQKIIKKKLLNKKKENERVYNNVVIIQKNIRKYLCRKKFINMIRIIIFIQRLYRKNRRSNIILQKKNEELKKKLEEKKDIEKINLERISKLEEWQFKMENQINDIKNMYEYNKEKLNNKESEIIVLNDDVDLYKETIIKTIDSKADMFEELEEMRRENELLKYQLKNKRKNWFSRFNFY